MKQVNLRKQIKSDRALKTNLNVVITGGTRGLGRAFAKEFSKQGDKVFILSRSQKDVEDLVKEDMHYMRGRACDVSKATEIKRIVPIILHELGTIDVWINNAGVSGGSRQLLELNDDKVVDIITTNMIGTCSSCKILHEVMSKQTGGGAIFDLAGAGSDGSPTPSYSIYGATKAGIVQFSKSLQKEWKDSIVDLHVISPGMMFTDLLTDNIPVDTLAMIDFLVTHPELVALHLVPRIKKAYYYDQESYIRFLTFFRVLGKFFMKGTRKI
jgi:chlorophyll(ide) b reductase